MNGEMGCERVQELAPELALDVAGGQERDAALRHVAGCPSCRRIVSELSSVGEDLLLLAPPRDPPPGFEARVITRLTAPPRRSRRGAVLGAVAAAFLAATIAAGAVLVATADDRRLAATYTELLSQAGGSYFAVAPLEGNQGRLGTVFAYEGAPSWVFVSAPLEEERQFQVRLVTRDGEIVELGDVFLGGQNAGWGRAIPVDLAQVRELRLVGPNVYLVASFADQDPWRNR